MTKWLPFGYMCMRNIAAKYNVTGVTDAITKHDAYVASKTFTPSNITKWVSTVEHAWAGWRNTVTDPEHMAAVELVREILSSDNEDGKIWASSFATTRGDKPYTVADLLEKVVNQDKLLNAGGAKKKATALLAGHGMSRPAFIPKNNKKGKQKKRCATKETAKILLGCTSTNSATTVILRARRNPLPKMSLLPWMMCPPLCASKITIVS
jgi:hypothetical protein